MTFPLHVTPTPPVNIPWDVPLNFKFLRRGLWLVALGSFSTGWGAELIRLQQPKSFSHKEEKVFLQGVMETPGTTRLEVSVRPFAPDVPTAARHYTFDLFGRSFQGEIELFPGLNLVSLQSPGQKVSAHWAFYGNFKKENTPHPSWGSEARFQLIEPMSLRVQNPTIPLRAESVPPSVRGVFAVTLSQRHFESLTAPGESDAERLPVLWIPVRQGTFQGAVTVEPGSQLVIVRPDGDDATRSTSILKPVIWEVTSDKISLDPPTADKNVWILQGHGGPHQKISLIISTLALDTKNQQLIRHTLFEASLTTDGSGVYHLQVPMTPPPPGVELKGFPLVEVSTGRDRATRTLVDWVPHDPL